MFSFFNKKEEPPPPSVPSFASRELQQARFEMEGLTDYFNRIKDTCFAKCVTKMNNPDLEVGEATCVDRCVSKYMEAQTVVGQELAKANAAQQQ